VNGPPSAAERLPNTLSISVKGLNASAVVSELGGELAFSAGSACHAGATTLSAVLRSMNMDEEWGKGTLRLSCGRHTTPREVDKAAELLTACINRRIIRHPYIHLGTSKDLKRRLNDV